MLSPPHRKVYPNSLKGQLFLLEIILNANGVLDSSVNMGKIEKLGRQTQAPACFLHRGGVRSRGLFL